MVRPMSFLLSFGLFGLFVAGQGAHVPQGIVWSLCLFSVLAFIGAMIAPIVSQAWRVAGPMALCAGLVAAGFVSLLMRSAPWMPLCIFLLTGAYLGVVVAELLWSPRTRGTMAPADS
jgi:hypothetical protein